MCKEGVDLTAVKVSLKQGADRIRLEEDHLRQWTALAANVNLEEVSEMLRKGCLRLAEAEEQVNNAIAQLVEAQMHGHTHDHGHEHTHDHDHGHEHGGGVTITPL